MSKRSGIEDIYPLTPMQEGMLFHVVYAPESGVYVGQFGFLLEGPLDGDALERAWRSVVARHEALRAGFAWEGVPRPAQVIRREVKLPFRREDWRGLDEAGRKERLERYLAEDRVRGFDLKRPPLMRLALFRLGEEEYQLVWTHHHLILDGWSLSLLFRDVLAHYAADVPGEVPRPGGARRYRDYVAWLERQDRSRAERYWREALAGFVAPTVLPAVRSVRGAEHGEGAAKLELGGERMEVLQERTRRWGVTLNTVVQGAWALLLGRYAGEEDVVFGATVSGRPPELAGADETVGMFINTLPVRVRLRGEITPGEWLAELQAEQAAAREHEYAPLVEVQKWSEVPAGEALFESVVVFENYPVDQALGDVAGKLRGLRVRSNLGREQASYPLLLTAEANGGLRMELLYDRGRVEEGAADRILRHLAVVLEALAAIPPRRLRDVSLLREAERIQVLEGWNAPGTYPRACVHELVSAQAARTPTAVAVVCGGRALTFAELEERAERLARTLRREGVGPERVVGICMEHSLDVVVALLGTLMSGGCCLLLDPAHPTARLAYLLEDAGVGVVVAQPHLRGRLLEVQAALRVVEAAGEAQAGEEATTSLPPVLSETAAYLVYTSGSTGQPKGVLVSHAAAAAHLVAVGQAYGLSPSDRMLVHAAQTFDSFLEQAFAPLVAGGSAALRDPVLWAPPEFAEKVAALGVTVADVVPAYWGQLVRERSVVSTLKRDLRVMLVGGEALPPVTVRAWREAGDGRARLLNAYGPTEAVVTTTVFEAFNGDGAAWGASVPIGRAVGGRTTYVLDARGEPVPVGVPGELHVGGVALARGYLGRAELTAEKFVPDAFGGDAGARLYRTGDQVRWMATGELEYLGRTDAQVKVRGVRIEPGEIEAVLGRHPSVREAVVATWDDPGGDRRLVGYVAAGEGSLAPGELRDWLRTRLPEYMVPRDFVLLDRLPLTPNGKIDRRALPAPTRVRAVAGQTALPGTPTEAVVAGIWEEVLGAEGIGAASHFFSLGGHSLSAMRVISRMREAFGVEVPLRAIFEAPTVAALAERVDRLWSGAVAVAPPIERVPREGLPPLSFSQQRLWLLDRLEPASPAYNMPSAVRLRGVLDVVALRASLDALVRRHEALRTVFAEQGGEPVQVVHDPAPVPLPVLDLRRLPEAEREAWAKRLAATKASRPFDLARGPLLRSTLLRLSGEDHVLLFTLHHIVSDGWSMGVLVREVFTLYGAFSRGEPASLPELPVQYADYAVWQRGWLRGEVLDRQLAWWRERLAGAPALLDLPTSGPRPSVQSHRGAVRSLRIDAATAAELRALGSREGATLFMTLLAGFAVFLGRWSGQADVVVGTPIANRARRETEGLIGFFLNTLALRTDLSGDPSFRELLGRVRDATLGAYAHQDLPFERILEELRPVRSLSHSPVFQVMLNLETLDDDVPADAAGVRMEPFGEPPPAAKYDLTLYASDGAGAIGLDLVYDADLFEDTRMAEALGHLGTLLAAVAADPELRVSRIPLPGEEELRARSARARGIGADGPFEAFARGEIEQTITARFGSRVRLHPDRLAVRTRTTRLTYAELERAADGVARSILRTRPAGPERVALLFEHDAAMIVGILGVLRAGKTYVPVDPLYPRERSAYAIKDSGAAAVVTNRANLALARELTGGRIPLIDAGAPYAEGSGAEAGAGAWRAVSPDEPAYILYTSGSTGRPKGVVQSHRNVLHFIQAYTENLRIGPDDRLTLFSSYTFDASVMAIYGALLNGASLFPFDWREEAAAGVAGWMRRERITLYHSTPTVFRHLVGGVAEGERFPEVRLVVLGGEEAQRRDVEAFRTHFPPGATLVNGLGPTESTVSLQHFIGQGEEPGCGAVPVGRPVAGTDVLLLNALGEQPAVYGVGEIVIRSPHVALGYWRRPEQTAAAFTPDPAGGPLRSYRTGDLGRRLPDGGIEFIGRSDFQFKVRGFRVEPGEVEAALLEHPAVLQAVAAPWEDERGERRLAAYWVAAAGAEASTPELRAWMRERIPEYMVPSALVRLEALPLTPSGKVDRLALPAPEISRGEAGTAPSSPAEALLAGIFAEVLGVGAVGAGEDFFELGGHSLLATRLVSRVREVFGVELPLRAVFEAPTAAALAARVEGARREGAPQPPPLVPVPRDGSPLPLSFAQQRLWFLDQLDPGSAAYNLSYPLRVCGGLLERALERALQRVVHRHELLRTRFPVADGEPVQWVEPAGPVRLPVVDLGALGETAREAELQRLVADEVARPFDLARGPLLRATVVRLGEDDAAVMFTMHHVVSDGWSMGILVREVSTLYEAFSRGVEARLPELPVQYADYAAWQRSWLSGEVLEAQLAYWRERLAGAPTLLELPTDRPRPVVLSGAGAAREFRVPAGTLRALRLLARREGATLFMTLLSAWQVLLSRYAGTEDVVVGTPIAGRTHVELEGLIGFFVNTLVLRGDLSGEPGFTELLGRVRESTLGAYQHQELPFEKLVEELGVERSLGSTPLFQVMLTLQNTGQGELVLGDLQLEALAGAGNTVNADLSFTLGEVGEALVGTLQYRTGLFDSGTVDRHLEHLGVLLEGIVSDPGRGIRQLPLLSDAERRRVVAEWNSTGAAYAGRPVHELFEAQVERTPAALAAVCGSESLTYAELRRRADRVAAALRASGIGRGAFVPVLLDRGLDVPVAMLGVMKSGAAFSPLDVHWPVARLRAILDDLDSGIVLVNGGTPFREEDLGRTLLRVDGEDFPGAGLAGESVRVEPGDPIYAIYTSGSTGTPKAAVVPHRGITNRFRWMDEYFGAEAASAVLQTTRHVYDSAVWQLLWPLVNGGRSVLPRSDEELAAEPLVGLVQRHGVTMTDFVPSVFNFLVPQLVSEGEVRRGLASLRAVVVGGEQITLATTHAFMQCFPEARVVNLYGPTEASIGCICYQVTGTEEGSIPIGRPIHNTHALVLDGIRQPVPVGVPGELYLSGACLGLGYLHDEARTGEVFVENPFPELGGGRMYRTGDRVRWLPDGNLEFLGRVDQQVKVRGLRIEPGEIEAALGAHPEVREAVVLVREDEPGERRLVGYVVCADGEVPETTLRTHLRERLPEYMVPSAFVRLERLPLTPNGKLDRRALPAPAAPSGEAYVAPRTPAEEMIAGIWADALKLERVGVRQGFFELGGHSLLATRVIARVRETFGVEVPLRLLFEASTAAEFAARVGQLQRDGRGLAAPPIVPVPREGRAMPLSFAQQRLWFLDQLEPGSAAYNMPYALRVRDGLDVSVLERVLTRLVARHETLRTTFAQVAGEPVQVVDPDASVRLSVVDLAGLPEPSRERELHRRAEEEVVRPFDLAAGPLLRALVVRLAEEDVAVLFTLHHIVSDGWSMEVLVREVSTLYDALSQGVPAGLPALKVQYADYAAWQRAWLSGKVLEAQLAYWREQLAGAPALLELPTDRPRAAAPGNVGGARCFQVPPKTAQALRALSRREGATLFMTLLSAWQVLLSRYAGTEDVVVGTPIAGRTHVELEGLIGFFVNTLVLRGDLSGEPGFTELLGRVRESTLGAYQHQELPFEKLVEELSVERRPGSTPLFQAMLVLQNNERRELELGRSRVEDLQADGVQVKFDLTLSLAESGEAIDGRLSYRAALWDVFTMERMLEHYGRVLEVVAAEPERRVTEVELLGEVEREQVLVEWNATGAQSPQGCVHELFEEQARRTPTVVAVVFGEETLTYAELEGRANRLAHHLRRRGVVPESRVGLYVERSPELVVAMLGILKAGGAYVPLDPSYPAERLAFMVADSRVSVVLTQARLRDRVPAGAGETVCLDGDRAGIAPESSEPCPLAVGPEGLAYILYTSGSTGVPKGVAVPHRAVVRLVRENDYAQLGAEQVFLQYASPSFDAATLEFWGPLLNGGRLVLPPAGMLSAEQLRAVLTSYGVTTLWLTAGLFHVLVDERVDALSGVRQLLAGGDVLSADHVRRVLRVHPGIRLVNGYGPTENTTFTCCHTLYSPEEVGETVPIGRPIAHTRVYVLDEFGGVVPVGVPGELYVGGAGLARGYQGWAELTAEKFVPDPFGTGERLYRTGDRVRWLASGVLEFLGRVDQQVKVRGFRVEPGEVEAGLLGLKGVREAVVTVREAAPGQKRLVAFVVPGEGHLVTPAELRAELGRRLPDYMLPGAIVVLDAFPVTPSGKVDRQALRAPDERAGGGGGAPRPPAEEVLAGIYAELLGIERVGSQDDFFALGGHSLLAMRAISRVREVFGLEVPLHLLFDAPTVAGLAKRIGGLQSTAASPAHPIERVSRAGRNRLPLSFAQQRLWFVYRMEPGSSAYNMPFPVRLRGNLDPRALSRAFSEIVRRHEVLRTVFDETGGEAVQVIRPAALVFLPIVDLRGLAGEARENEVRRLTGTDAALPFDLQRGPVVRATLLRMDAAEWGLLLNVHHIACDGWSTGILVGELSALYAAFRRGEASPLPAPQVQYADFASWQREWLSGERLEEQLAYWRGALAGAAPTLDLPTDRPRPPVPGARGATHHYRFPADVSQGLRALCRREAVTPYMALSAAWQLFLARWAGQEDVSVGTAIAGRNRLELEGLIGFFVNTLVLRVDLSGRPTVRELLRRSRATTLGAFAHQELPFEKLVEELAPARSLQHAPLFQVMFSMLNLEIGELKLGEAAMEPLDRAGESTKFDLNLMVREDGDRFGGHLTYRSDLFEAETVHRALEHFATLVSAMVGDPDRPVATLPLMGEVERRQVLTAWNDTAGEYPRQVPVHALFERQVERTPAAPALLWGGGALTYADLDARADDLASALAVRGVRPEVRVGVCLERGPELVVALLAVLKAGGVYVPLDPTHPAKRLAWLLEDSAVSLLLTKERWMAKLPGFGGGTVLLDGTGTPAASTSVREAGGSFATRPAHVPVSSAPEGLARGLSADSLAYVIYTSGSTGRPKGVLTTHGSVVNYLAFLADEYGVGPADTVLQLATASFDASIRDILGPLTTGAKLMLMDPNEAAEPWRLLASIREHGVTAIMAMVPSLLRPLLDAAEAEGEKEIRTLRLLLMSGEVLPVADVRRAHHAFGAGVRVVNQWGATECTMSSTLHSAADVEESVITPIGRPIRNTRVYVLDAELEPTPPGVPGEAYISTPGVARGYGGRPELTAERFVPDPFSREPGARMYRVGDRVRWRRDGVLEFHGRMDTQVKVQGVRVEPGEVEAVLRAHPDVQAAAVVVCEETPGEARLVGYVVAEEGVNVPTAELRSWLADRLPSYLVPPAFVALGALPLTPNGKLDRRALLAPAAARGADACVSPRDVLELQLARAWEELLGIRPVGVRDDFFALGGHSLLALRLVAAVERLTGRQVSLATLLAGPTVERLACVLRGQAALPAVGPLVPIQPNGGEPPIFFVHAAGGSAVSFAALARHLGPDQPSYALQSRGFEGEESPHVRIEAMAADYLVQLRAVQGKGPYRLAGWSMGGLVAFEMARMLEAAGEEVGLLALLDSRAPSVASTADPDDPGLLASFMLHLGFPRERIAGAAGEIAALTSDERLWRAWQAARAADVVPDDLQFARFERLWTVFHANVRAAASYRPEPCAAPLLLVLAGDRPAPAAPEVERWEALTTGNVRSATIFADHFTLVREPHVGELATLLANALSSAPPREQLR